MNLKIVDKLRKRLANWLLKDIETPIVIRKGTKKGIKVFPAFIKTREIELIEQEEEANSLPHPTD